MRLRILAFASTALALAPAYAQNDQVQQGPVPQWVTISEPLPVPSDASGLVFVRRQDSLIHLDDQGQHEYVGYRLKILHPNALQEGNLALVWNPASGAPIVHGVEVFRDGNAIDVLEHTSFEILRREDQLEFARLDGNLTAVLRVSDLRVGDELEFAYTTSVNDPTLGQMSAGLLMLSPSPPLGRFRLGLSWEDGQRPSIQATSDFEAAATQHQQAIEYRFDNPGILAPPKDAPPRYFWQRLVEFSDFRDWAEVSRHFSPIYAQASQFTEDSPLNREVARIAAEYSDPLERAQAALKLVQQDVRYIYVGLDGGNLKPATADETWQRRYGDCKGKTALLLGLLAELGLEAEAVLVSNSGTDDGLDERLPSPRAFDHVLVRARINGNDYFLDGTLPPVASLSPDPVISYKWILPITAQGSPIEHLAWSPKEAPNEINLFEIDARAGFDQPARKTSITIRRGLEGLQQQFQYSGLTPSQLFDALRQSMIGEVWQEIEDIKWHYDQDAKASILTVIGKGAVDWDDDGDGARSLTLPGGGFSPPQRRVRPSDQNQDAPYYNKGDFDCHVTTVRLPDQTDASQWSFNSGFDTRMFGQNYYRAFDLRDGAIRMIRGFRVEQQEVDAELARRDNDRIARFDNSMASIYYDPEDENAPTASGHSIPATYEIDWTAPNVPCLSPATLSGASMGGNTDEDNYYGSANAEEASVRSEALLREGRYDEAIAVLRSALETMPGNTELRLVQAFAQLQLGEVDAAKQSLTIISSAAKNDHSDFMARGLLASMRNDHEAALKAYGDALAVSPGFGIAHMLRAGAHYALGELDLAVDDADRAIQAGIATPALYSIKAGVAAYRGDKARVIALVDEMLEALPDSVEAKDAAVHILNEYGLADHAMRIGSTGSEEPDTVLGLLNRAKLRDAGDIEGKLADYRAAIELEADAYEPYHARAELYWQNSEYEKALQDVEMALRLEPRSGQTYLLKANILKRLGRNEEVGRTAEDLMAAIPGETYPFVAASKIFAAIGDRERALEAIDGALAIRPEAYIFLNRAELRDPSDYVSRLSDIEEALKREPKQKGALGKKAELLRMMGDHFSAVRIYDDILSRDDSNADALSGRGLALWKLGRDQEARKDFAAARAIARNPTDLNSLCFSKAKEDVALELALEECNLALDQGPMNLSILDSRGYVYLRLRRPDDAIADFTAVIERSPGVGSAYFGRGLAYEQKGDLTLAALNKDMALEHSPGIEDDLGVYGFKLLN